MPSARSREIFGSASGLLMIARPGSRPLLSAGGVAAEEPGFPARRLRSPRTTTCRVSSWIASGSWICANTSAIRERYGNLQLPAWLDPAGPWRLIAPLLVGNQLLGFLVLRAPPEPFNITFEDLDLLKTVGRNVAVQLAQRRADEQLAESRQFDAYNRFAAFVMHDLKNSVAQLQLLVANAARHRHNPVFVDDAIDTIRNTSERMTRLIEQLQARDMQGTARVVELGQIVGAAVARSQSRQPAVTVDGEFAKAAVQADPDRLTAVLEHVMRNAQEATGAAGAVSVELAVEAQRRAPDDRSTMARAWTRSSCASACSGRSTAPRARRAWESAPTRCANTRAPWEATSRCGVLPGGAPGSVLGCRYVRRKTQTPDRRRRSGAAEAAEVVLRRVRSAHGRVARAKRWRMARRFEPAVVLQDLGLPPDAEGVTEGMQTLREILSLAPQTKVIVVTGNADRDNAVRAVSLGAYDFYQKPVDTDVLRLLVGRAFHIHALEEQNRQLREAQLTSPMEGFIATDDAMLKVCRMIEKVAPDRRVGADPRRKRHRQGTGRARVALAERPQGAHVSSRSTARRFRSSCSRASCSATRRAPSPAPPRPRSARSRRRAAAPCSSTRSATCRWRCRPNYCASCRIASSSAWAAGRRSRSTCASCAPPIATCRQFIIEQKFRQDLYFRIGEVTINVPPLRERMGGATVLAHAMLRKFSNVRGRPKRGFTEEATAALEAYAWPGNVRELENRVKTAMIMAETPMLTAEDLGLKESTDSALLFNLKEVRTRAERQAIRQAMSITEGNVSKTAELLGVSRPTLYDLMEKYGIRAPT